MVDPNATRRLCPNGHVLDPAWTVCPYCPSDRGAAAELARTVAGQDPAKTVVVQDPAKTVAIQDPAKTVAIDDPGRTVRIEDAAPTPPASPMRRTEVLERTVPLAAVGWLVAAAGPHRGRMQQVSAGRVTVGAAPDCDLVLDEPHVSEHHASIRIREQDFVITDLDSTNGTFVNDHAIGQQALADGDRIRFGASEWVFKCVVFDAR